MPPTRVAVLASHPLFGEGIAALLRSDRRLEVLRVDPDDSDRIDELRTFEPDAIVLEVPEEAAVLERLRDMRPCLYVCVRLGDSAADVYRDRRIIYAQPEEIIEAIQQGIVRSTQGAGS